MMAQPSLSLQFAVFFAGTLAVEGAVAYFFFGGDKDRKFLYSVLAINAISYPITWFAVAPIFYIYIAELFAIIFEGAAIYAINKPKMGLKRSFFFSAVANLASAIIGLVIINIILNLPIYNWIFGS